MIEARRYHALELIERLKVEKRVREIEKEREYLSKLLIKSRVRIVTFRDRNRELKKVVNDLEDKICGE